MAVLWNPDNPVWSPALDALHAAAPALRVKLFPVAARNPSELEHALALAVSRRVRGLLVVRDRLFIQHQKSIVEFTANRRLATIFGVRDSVVEGGLMSYGTNLPDTFRHAAAYVDKILKGQKPAELPIEQATQFELVVNLKTAKLLGLTIPDPILLRADEVIR